MSDLVGRSQVHSHIHDLHKEIRKLKKQDVKNATSSICTYIYIMNMVCKLSIYMYSHIYTYEYRIV